MPLRLSLEIAVYSVSVMHVLVVKANLEIGYTTAGL